MEALPARPITLQTTARIVATTSRVPSSSPARIQADALGPRVPQHAATRSFSSAHTLSREVFPWDTRRDHIGRMESGGVGWLCEGPRAHGWQTPRVRNCEVQGGPQSSCEKGVQQADASQEPPGSCVIRPRPLRSETVIQCRQSVPAKGEAANPAFTERSVNEWLASRGVHVIDGAVVKRLPAIVNEAMPRAVDERISTFRCELGTFRSTLKLFEERLAVGLQRQSLEIAAALEELRSRGRNDVGTPDILKGQLASECVNIPPPDRPLIASLQPADTALLRHLIEELATASARNSRLIGALQLDLRALSSQKEESTSIGEDSCEAHQDSKCATPTLDKEVADAVGNCLLKWSGADPNQEDNNNLFGCILTSSTPHLNGCCDGDFTAAVDRLVTERIREQLAEHIDRSKHQHAARTSEIEELRCKLDKQQVLLDTLEQGCRTAPEEREVSADADVQQVSLEELRRDLDALAILAIHDGGVRMMPGQSNSALEAVRSHANLATEFEQKIVAQSAKVQTLFSEVGESSRLANDSLLAAVNEQLAQETAARGMQREATNSRLATQQRAIDNMWGRLSELERRQREERSSRDVERESSGNKVQEFKAQIWDVRGALMEEKSARTRWEASSERRLEVLEKFLEELHDLFLGNSSTDQRRQKRGSSVQRELLEAARRSASGRPLRLEVLGAGDIGGGRGLSPEPDPDQS